ncbi:MAG: hypothetical protein QNJ97_13705 [Myxococcota bacterium]|nr:hypothetical protein [Myxococcota bacterium]
MSRYLLLTLSLLGCATTVPTQKDAAFSFAVEAVSEKSYTDGAKAAWLFIDAADPDDPRYDRGLRLLARSAEELELFWAAGMLYREIAQARRNMELVPDALRGLERLKTVGAYDEDTFITAFIAGETFGELPRDLRAFVDYEQGLDLARRGADEWSKKRFNSIPQDSPYHERAAYVQSVRFVAEGQIGSAREILNQLGEQEDLEQELKLDVERTLARLAFEEEDFSVALDHFETLKELAPDDPDILLEMAWTHYYLGDSRKTLGLLVALDAPVHQSYISPERYLLEALALRRLCQFGAARQAAVGLERKYAESLRMLSQGILPQDIPEMRAAAQRRGQSKANARFLARLHSEKELVQSLSDDLGSALAAYLHNLYSRGLAEAGRRERETINADLDALTEELLAAREGVRLIVHELGVSLLRGRRRPAGALEKPAVDVPLTGELVFYSFGGEYWTDEMDDLVVIAEDRCID